MGGDEQKLMSVPPNKLFTTELILLAKPVLQNRRTRMLEILAGEGWRTQISQPIDSFLRVYPKQKPKNKQRLQGEWHSLQFSSAHSESWGESCTEMGAG